MPFLKISSASHPHPTEKQMAKGQFGEGRRGSGLKGRLAIYRLDEMIDKALPSKSNIEETLNKCDQSLFIVIGTHQSFCLLLPLGKGFALIHGTRTVTSKTQERQEWGRDYSSAPEEPSNKLRGGPPLSLLTLFFPTFKSG